MTRFPLAPASVRSSTPDTEMSDQQPHPADAPPAPECVGIPSPRVTRTAFADVLAPSPTETQDAKVSPEDSASADLPDTPLPADMPPDDGTAPAAEAASQLPGVPSAWSRLGWLTLLFLLLAQTWACFQGQNLYTPAEIPDVLAYRAGLAHGLWLHPAADTGFAQWPGFFWYLRALDWCLAQVPQLAPLLFPLAAVLGAVLALWAVLILGRAAGLGRDAALAGGLVLVCAPLFTPLVTFTAPHGLALALTLLSLACLCRGWCREHAYLLLPPGFLFAGLAGFVGGPTHLLLPLATSLLFVLWRGTLRRARKLDGILGFFLLLSLLGIWLGAVILWKPAADYLPLLGQRLTALPPITLWWKPLLLAAVGLLPWLVVILCVFWWRIVRHPFRNLAASRKERAGTAFLWIALACAGGLSLLNPNFLDAALVIGSVAALLLGKSIVRLGPAGSRMFHALMALTLLACGSLLVALHGSDGRALLAELTRITLNDTQVAFADLQALPVLGGFLIAAGVVAARFALWRPVAMGKTLLVYAVLAVLLAQPTALLLAPQLATLPQTQLQSLEALTAPAKTPTPDAAVPPTPAMPAATPTPDVPTPSTPTAPEAKSATGTTTKPATTTAPAVPDAAAPQPPSATPAPKVPTPAQPDAAPVSGQTPPPMQPAAQSDATAIPTPQAPAASALERMPPPAAVPTPQTPTEGQQKP